MRAVVIGIEKGKAAIFEKNGGMRYIPDAGYVRGQLIEVPDVDKVSGTIPFVRTGSGLAGKRAFRYGVGIAAAVSIVLAGGGVTAYASTASTVTVGTYPEIEYRVNYFDRVIGLDINGDDIEIPQEDIRSINKKIRGKKLDKAMEISFDEINTDVIISEDMRDDPIRVDSGNPRRKEKLEGRARDEFDEAIERKIIIERPADEMPAGKQGDIDTRPTDTDDSNCDTNIKSGINNNDSVNESVGGNNTGGTGNSGNSGNIKEDKNPSGQPGQDQQPGQGDERSGGGQSGQGGTQSPNGQSGQNQGQNVKPSDQPSSGQSGQGGNKPSDGQQGQNQGQNGQPSNQPSNGRADQGGNQSPNGQPGQNQGQNGQPSDQSSNGQPSQGGNQPPDGQPGSDPGQVNPPPEQPSDGQPMDQPPEGQPGQDQGQNGQPMDQPPDGQPGQGGSNPPGDQPGANQGQMNPPSGTPQGQQGDQPY